jgi:hypothetical protein
LYFTDWINILKAKIERATMNLKLDPYDLKILMSDNNERKERISIRIVRGRTRRNKIKDKFQNFELQ